MIGAVTTPPVHGGIPTAGASIVARRLVPVRVLQRPAAAVRNRVAAAAAAPFGHARPPLAHTLDHPGDPGLFGPESVTWQVMGQVTTFIGGIRGLLVQACHPEVVTGVHEHSRYEQDPLGRLSRTAFYVTTTAFGAMPEVDQAVDFVRGRHRPVHGTSPRGRSYDANDPAMAAWVHNALTDSFLAAHQAYGRAPLSSLDADRFVAEQRQVGALLGADPMPATADGLSHWVARHPAVAPSPGMHAAVAFLRDPPLRGGVRLGYRVLFDAAVATLPDELLAVLGLRARRAGRVGGVVADRFLWAMMGDSPAWRIALERVGADTGVGTFRRPRPGARAG